MAACCLWWSACLPSLPLGTYTLFQETYHRATFKAMHPYGPKSDYDHRLLTMDRYDNNEEPACWLGACMDGSTAGRRPGAS